MAEPREVQRLERMKVNANKYMSALEANPNDKNAAKRLQDMLAGIELCQFEAAAATVKEEQKKGGVHIEVPAAHFALKKLPPVAVEEAE